jgi:hypothetical protein
VAHAYNLNYSGGRNQEDHCSKPAQARLYLKNTHHKRAGGMAQGEGQFQAPVQGKKQEKTKKMGHV